MVWKQENPTCTREPSTEGRNFAVFRKLRHCGRYHETYSQAAAQAIELARGSRDADTFIVVEIIAEAERTAVQLRERERAKEMEKPYKIKR